MLSELEQAKIQLADAVLQSMRVKRDYIGVCEKNGNETRCRQMAGADVARAARRVESLMSKDELRRMKLR